MDEKDREKLHTLLDENIIKCGDNKNLLTRLSNYIETTLPTLIENIKKNNEERKERREILEEECGKFINRFLQKYQYYYLSYADLFIKYDKEVFHIYSEDKILHEALTSIPPDSILMAWKYKIKNIIIKTIKERSPLNVIPESCTIQKVINEIYPKYFTSKNSAKYFLTIIGDYLLGKSDNSLIFLADNSLKELIKTITYYAHMYCGVSNISQSIKFKYHEHQYDKCRLLSSVNSKIPIDVTSSLKKIAIDFLCISAHYSIRSVTSDGFIDGCNDIELREYVKFLHNNNLNTITDIFINKMIEGHKESEISSKNMLYLWKKFLGDQKLPNISFYNSLQLILKEKLTFNENKDSYIDITSSQLPVVSSFITFWDVNMEKDDYGELEIEEIIILFCEWSNKMNRLLKVRGEPTEVILELITHFFPDVIIYEGKYICGVSCKLWNKQLDVLNAIETYKLEKNEMHNNIEVVTLDSIYEYYSKSGKKKMVSKKYFEKIGREILNEYLDEDGFIIDKWFKSCI